MTRVKIIISTLFFIILFALMCRFVNLIVENAIYSYSIILTPLLLFLVLQVTFFYRVRYSATVDYAVTAATIISAVAGLSPIIDEYKARYNQEFQIKMSSYNDSNTYINSNEACDSEVKNPPEVEICKYVETARTAQNVITFRAMKADVEKFASKHAGLTGTGEDYFHQQAVSLLEFLQNRIDRLNYEKLVANRLAIMEMVGYVKTPIFASYIGWIIFSAACFKLGVAATKMKRDEGPPLS